MAPYDKARRSEAARKNPRARRTPSDWPSRNPDPRLAALLMAARKTLGFTGKEAAALVDRSFETLTNAERAVIMLGKQTEPRLLRRYLQEFARRGGRMQIPPESADVTELRFALAQAMIGHKAANFAQSLRGTDGGVNDFVDGVLSAAIQEDVITPKLRERLLGVSR